MADPSGGGIGDAHDSRIVETAVALCLLAAFVVWQTWPLAARLGSDVWGLAMLDFIHPDVYLNLWIVSWVARLTAVDPLGVPHLPAFHPVGWTLGYSEHMLGVLPVTLPAYLLSGDPVVVNQVLLLATFVLSAVSIALLTAYWTRSAAGAVVAGAFFALARWRFRNVPQIQLLATFYAPLVLLFSSRYLQAGGSRNLLAAGAAFLGQGLCSYSMAYPMYVGTAGFWVALALALRVARRRLLMLFAAGAVATACLAIASLPQIIVQRHGTSDTNPGWNAGAMLERGGGAPLSAWVDPSSKMFPGWACGSLALAGLITVLAGADTRRWRGNGRALVAGLAAFALPLIVLAVGPAEGADGSVLGFVWRTVPGLAHYRHPQRFGYLVWLPLAALAGMAVALFDQTARVRGRLPRLAAWSAVGVGLIVFGWTQQRSRHGLRLAPVPPRPAVYDWVKEHVPANEPVLEIPAGIAAPRGFRYRADPEYLLWNFHHQRPLVNGYSGYAPLGYPLVLSLATELPGADALETLKRLTGVRWIIVHQAKLEPAERERWDGSAGLAVAARAGDDVVLAVPKAELDWRELYEFPPAHETLAGSPLAEVDGPAALSVSVPDRVEAGKSLAVKVLVRNAGTAVWPSLSPRPEQRVAVVWRWAGGASGADDAGAAIRPALLGWETIRPLRPMPPPMASVIPRDLKPGESVEVGTVITSPRVAGSYDLIAEVVQGEGRRFATQGAADLSRRPVRVLGSGS